LTNIEDIVDAFLELLHLHADVTSDDAWDLERQVLFSLREYMSSASKETERHMRAVGHLAERLEPFQRKLFMMRYPGQDVPSFRQLLEIVAGCQSKPLRKPTEEEILANLLAQSTEDANFHDAYYFRNTWAHEARKLNPREESRYWRSVVASFLLIVRRNLDLAPSVTHRVARSMRIYSGLRVCLRHVQRKFDDTKWHNQYYIDLTLGEGGMLEEYEEEFLTIPTKRLLVIAGRTGAGKSTCLERLVTRLANRSFDSLDREEIDHLVIPVHFELKRYAYDTNSSLVRELFRALNRGDELGIDPGQHRSWPRVLSPARFVFCLDGLDEVGLGLYHTVISEIDHLACEFENVQVIVTGRSHSIPEHWHSFVVHISPLSAADVILYFEHPERLNFLAAPVRAFLEDRPDLVDILQDPLMAEAACRYWSQFEPPGSSQQLDSDTEREALMEGPLLEHLYRCFFDHHLRRMWLPRGKESFRANLVNALAALASAMDGDPLANFDLISDTFARFELAETDLGSILDTGLLKLVEGDYSFRNDTVKGYFAARRLRSLTRQKRDIPQALLLIQEANSFWDCSIRLLKEIAPLSDCTPLEAHLASLAQTQRATLQEVQHEQVVLQGSPGILWALQAIWRRLWKDHRRG